MTPAPERPDLSYEHSCWCGEQVLHALVTPAEDAGLREAALAFDEAMRHGDDFLTPEQHSALRALRAALSRQAEKETA